MDKTILITLLISAALAMPAWMAWRKANKRPWLVGWLLVVGLLILPYGVTVWLHPEWLNHPVAGLGQVLGGDCRPCFRSAPWVVVWSTC